ncbi:MAG TPA: cytochrome c4 [Gammaproteobacteria bacterium]|nr:cytochrome c4 [Gammaproteobacteria bacterium]
MQMFQSGERDVPLMTAQLIGKSAQDLEDLAAYYASLPGKIGEAVGSDEDIKTARMIYKGGIADRGVAACAACHGPGGLGNDQAGFPVLGGQSVAYTVAQLTAYREGLRASDEEYGAMMRNVASGLTDGQIRVLADYIHGLTP